MVVGPVIVTVFAEMKFVLRDPMRPVLATRDPAVKVEIVPTFAVIVPVEIVFVEMEPMEAFVSTIEPVDRLFTFNEPTVIELVEMAFVLIVDIVPIPKVAVPEESVFV